MFELWELQILRNAIEDASDQYPSNELYHLLSKLNKLIEKEEKEIG